MALTPEQIKAGLKTLKPTQITEQKAPVIMPSTTTPTTNIMPKVTQVQPLSPKQNIMSPSLQVQSGVQPEKDYKALATPEEKAKVIKMLQAGYPEATVREGFRQAIDRRLTQENTARGQEPKNYVDQNNMPIQPEVPLQGGIRYAPSRTPGILPEPVENFFEKANPIGRLTQFIDENVQKIPTITRQSVAEAFKGTPFEGMEALPTMVANTPGSLLKTASATARGITNPFDTIVGLVKLVGTEEGRQAVVDRYGSIEGLKKTMTEDPVGLASDALTLVQGGAGIAGKGAKLAGFTDTASKLSNFSKAAGTAADLGLSTIIPQGLQKVSSLGENQPGLANKALNTVAKGLVSGTQPIQSVKDTYSEIKSIIPKKPLEKIIQKDVMKGFRPLGKQVELAGGQEQYVQKATDAVKTISNLKDQIELTTSDGDKITGKTPETISQLDESIPQAKRKIYEAYSSEAEKAGTVSRIDTTPIVQELLTLRDKMKKMIGGGNTVSYIDNVIKDIQNKGQMGVIDALDNTQQLNSKLQAYYRNPNPNDIGNSVVDALVNSKLKEGIDTTIDSSLLDSKYADIKKQYANLKAIEKDVKNRSNLFARGNNKGFFDITDIFTAGEAINAITTFSPAGVVKSGGMFALKELWKYLNSPDTAVKNIFKEVNKQVGEQIQPSTTLNQKGLPLIPEKKTPITPTGVVQETTPNAPVPTVQTKTPIVEKGRATHDPYKTVTMDTKVVAPKKTVVPKTTPVKQEVAQSTTAPKKQSVLPKPQEKQAVLEGKKQSFDEYFNSLSDEQLIELKGDASRGILGRGKIREIWSKENPKTPIVLKKNITEKTKTLEKKSDTLDTLNPTGGLNVKYDPASRANMKLGKNITTLDKTMGVAPEKEITIYRGTVNNQNDIVPGDFITTNYDLAKSYAGEGKVISKKVKASEILDDVTEPLGDEYIYRPQKSPVPTPKAPVSTTPEVSYTKSPEGKRLADGKPIKEDSNTYRMLDRAEQRKLDAKKAKESSVSKELQPLYDEAKKYKTADEFIDSNINFYHQSQSPTKFEEFKYPGESGYKKASYSNAKRGIYFSTNKEAIKGAYGANGGVMMDVSIQPKKTLDIGEYDSMYFDGKKVNYGDIVKENFQRSLKGMEEIPEPDIRIIEIDSKAEKRLKSKGYDSIYGAKNPMMMSDEFVVLDKNIIKTESQLRKIREEANTTNKVPVKTPVPVKKVESVSKDLQPLYEEARKYKSADEFVGSKGKPVYHGTDKKFEKFKTPVEGEYGSEANFFSPTEQGADYYRRTDKGEVKKIYLDNDVKVWDREKETNQNDLIKYIEGLNDDDLNRGKEATVKGVKRGTHYIIQDPIIIKYIKNKGFDGFTNLDHTPNGIEETIGIFSPDKIKTEAQLRKIREEAQRQ